jgi:hypothetical protein
MKKLSYYLMAFLFAAAVSCSDKNEFTSTDTQSVENEATTDAYFEDTDDIATQAVSAEAGTTSGSREGSAEGTRPGTKPDDNRVACATFTMEFAADNSQAVPHGYITIDFGTGCTDARGNVRKGKIKVEFKGKKFLPGSTVITTLDGYYINGVKIEGTRTVTIAATSTLTQPKFSVAVTDGKATWADGTFATREAFRTVAVSIPSGDLTVTQTDGKAYTAAGTNRDGKTYQVVITKPLVYKRTCALSSKVFIAVEGTKVLTTESKTITIDYGDGTCDKKVTLTSNSRSLEVTIGDI